MLQHMLRLGGGGVILRLRKLSESFIKLKGRILKCFMSQLVSLFLENFAPTSFSAFRFQTTQALRVLSSPYLSQFYLKWNMIFLYLTNAAQKILLRTNLFQTNPFFRDGKWVIS